MDSRHKYILTCLVAAFSWSAAGTAQEPGNAELYESACAACHGEDGTGRAQEDSALEIQPPDFTDCEFASREPDADWYAIIHDGGPVRAFDRMMPAFGDALTEEEAYKILAHIRTMCTDDRWPRGEFNLPRPMYTEKAFPEDEAVFTLLHDTGDTKATEFEFLYEKRFGPVGMVEFSLPLVRQDNAITGSESGMGDVAVGYKHALYHDLDSGNIFSIGAEIILPTGDEDKGLGKGTTVLEPFVAYGKLLPHDMFFQAHAFAEFPVESEFEDEFGLRMAFGKTWTSGGEFGRAWSPMIEVLAVRELASGAKSVVDVVPQVQVALNTRQHILLNVAARIPATETAGRDTQIGVYLLWDWFDGGFFDGW
jgi:hypothetical protein